MNILNCIIRRVITHSVLAPLTVITGGLTAPLHAIAEKGHILADIKDITGGEPDINNASDIDNCQTKSAVASDQPSFGGYDSNEKYENTETGEVRYGNEIKENGHGGTHPVESYTTDSYADADSSDKWKKIYADADSSDKWKKIE